MSHSHHPVVYLARFGTKWLLIALALFILTSPVTIGVTVALIDHYVSPGFGDRLFGFSNDNPGPVLTPPKRSSADTCQFHVAGHTFTVMRPCSQVHFRGRERDANLDPLHVPVRGMGAASGLRADAVT